MKKILVPALGMALLSLGTTVVRAQEKEKKTEALGEYDQIIIKRKGDHIFEIETKGPKGDKGSKGPKGDKDIKLSIVIKDDKIEVNGKPLAEFEDDRVAILKRNIIIRDGNTMRMAIPRTPRSPFQDGTFEWKNNGDQDFEFTMEDKAFLGVASEKADKGVVITEVTGGSAAEKAGLKAGDIITKVDDESIGSPDELSKAVKKHKPGDKVTITYKRDGKDNRLTATLAKMQMAISLDRMPFLQELERGQFPPEGFRNENFDFRFNPSGQPKLGIKAQDTEEGKGVKVIEVDEGSAAEKAGIRDGDIITSFDGKEINSVNELVEISRAAREAKKSAMPLTYKRDNKEQQTEIKVPRRLRTAEL
ncbi:PDZ domain-containing protein [Flavihumibacter stibioxidans]|nr:PDZ domain-containing protein [Flavihumibacter stibioxidans]